MQVKGVIRKCDRCGKTDVKNVRDGAEIYDDTSTPHLCPDGHAGWLVFAGYVVGGKEF